MPAPKTVRSNRRLRASTIAARLDGMEEPSRAGRETDQYRGVLVPFSALSRNPVAPVGSADDTRDST
jgi:hypothetical protein